MDDMRAAYLAGVMDSDGWFTIVHHATNSKYAHCFTYSERVGCGQAAPEAVELLQAEFGGSIFMRRRRAQPNWKPLHYWVVSNKLAADTTRALRPYLLVKAAQADLVLALRASKERPRELIRTVATGVPGGKGLNAEVVAERHSLFERVRALNDRRASNLGEHAPHEPFAPPA